MFCAYPLLFHSSEESVECLYAREFEQSYEGGFGQTPGAEAIGASPITSHTSIYRRSYCPDTKGGTTYCALAALSLVPRPFDSSSEPWITAAQREQTVRWLLENQTPDGGFSGRTGKAADACYCFWDVGGLEVGSSTSPVKERY